MAKMTMIARPYAKACFELALAQDALADWAALLACLAAIAGDPVVRRFLADPRASQAQRGQFFIAVCGERLDAQGKRLIQVLSVARRLVVLPEIFSEFQHYRDAYEGVHHVEVVSARDLTPPQKKALQDRLTKRLEHVPALTYAIDASLLGGLVVRIGDRVIDGSVVGRVKRLNNALLQ